VERLASLKELMAIDSDRLDELEHSLTTFEVGTYDTTILPTTACRLVPQRSGMERTRDISGGTAPPQNGAAAALGPTRASRPRPLECAA
jgi:hypothetical protein